VTEAAHKCVHSRSTPSLRRVLLEPLAEGGVQCFVLSSGYQSSLLDQTLISAQSDIFHPVAVYAISVYSSITQKQLARQRE
jgi:hypothetical protein